MKNFQTHPQCSTSANHSSQLSDRLQNAIVRFRRVAAAPALFFLFCLSANICHAQSRDVVCREGVGDFAAEFLTGVKVRVGPARNEELEARVCEAALSWGEQNLPVADAASQ